MGDFVLHKILRFQFSIPPWEKDFLSWSTGKTKVISYALTYLGVLTLLGDVEVLQFYSKSFAVFDQLGFDENREDLYREEIHLKHALLIDCRRDG
ncbi:hypothetical protein [Bartonella henselae]|uniref:hypothetical protein n=1 Tax=Bartonella henselae TaxID=38323 RepID=UPI000684BA31|nr:hypothetical protein [Bartonella henselae]OLL40670.1 hypothetical protein AT237_06205 [Bartonella henselae]